MDGAKLTGKVYKGYGIAAKRIGLPFDVYRQTRATGTPISPENLLYADEPMAFTVHKSRDFSFNVPSDYKSALYHALADGAKLIEGDFCVDRFGKQGAFYIASMQPSLPILAISCNRSVTMYRQRAIATPPSTNVATYDGYSGETRDDDPVTGMDKIVEAIPVSILFKSPVARKQGALPGDTQAPGAWEMLFPPILGMADDLLREHDVAVDDIGRIFDAEDVERNSIGFRVRLRHLKV